MRLLHATLTGALLAGLVGCAGTSAPTTTPESTVPVATIRVADETFRVRLGTQALVQAARAAQAGGAAKIPNGRIVAGTDVNTGWSWHLEDLEFAEMTMALCDGRPSDVEKAGTSYGGGRFCPWGATVIGIAP